MSKKKKKPEIKIQSKVIAAENIAPAIAAPLMSKLIME